MEVFLLDLSFSGYPHAIGVYLVVGPSGATLVEAGPGSTRATLTARLADHGYAPPDIGHVLLTHIHLDHAGNAGWWAQQGATIGVHHVGAPHLVDPSRLLASAGRVYGEALDTLWGEFLPAPAGRVLALRDGDRIEAGGLSIEALETDGHANHHLVYVVEGAAFTGDICGIRLPETSLIELPTPPPDFHLERWLASLERLRGLQLRTLYPTHFGPIEDAAGHLDQVEALLRETVSFVRDRLEAGLDRDEILVDFRRWHQSRAQEAGVPIADYARHEALNPPGMCVDGVLRYLQKYAS